MNVYKCYWIHDPLHWQIIKADSSWAARKQFRQAYIDQFKADVPVHECVAIRGNW